MTLRSIGRHHATLPIMPAAQRDPVTAPDVLKKMPVAVPHGSRPQLHPWRLPAAAPGNLAAASAGKPPGHDHSQPPARSHGAYPGQDPHRLTPPGQPHPRAATQRSQRPVKPMHEYPLCAAVPLQYRPAAPALERVICARLSIAADSLTCMLSVRQGSQSYSDATCDSNSSADAMRVVSGHGSRPCLPRMLHGPSGGPARQPRTT
jgi:hypothetical protein